jgi:hypothetical protein
MVAGAHLVVAGFLAVVAVLEWRSAFPRRRTRSNISEIGM